MRHTMQERAKSRSAESCRVSGSALLSMHGHASIGIAGTVKNLGSEVEIYARGERFMNFLPQSPGARPFHGSILYR